MIKTVNKLVIEEKYPNIRKVIYKRPRDNIIPNSEKLKVFPLNSGTRQGFPHSPLLLNTVPEFLARAIRHEKEINSIQIGKISLFTDDMILYVENPKITHRHTMLELIN